MRRTMVLRGAVPRYIMQQGTRRVDNSGGIQASLAGRYASALYNLAHEKNALDAVESSLATLKKSLADSDDFRAFTKSHVISRDEAVRTIAALADAMKIDPVTRNFLGVLADNRRLDQLSPAIAAFGVMLANYRGEVTANVTSAFPLAADQINAISAQLKSRAGRNVKIETHVDPSILGGLIVKMGSQMIDSSIKTRLNTLSHAMKG